MATTREFLLELVGARWPHNSYLDSTSKKHWVEIDLEQAFHHGHIEIYPWPPAPRTNPLWALYEPMLTPDEEFRWIEAPGRGDHAVDESHRFGAIIGRAYLAQSHNYRWFAPIKELQTSPARGWSVSRITGKGGSRARGNMPDWLITGNGFAAIAEAKGTNQNVGAKSKILHPWRRQVKNVVVSKNGSRRSMKTWIVASRYVDSDQPNILPKIYAEDPPGEGAELDEEELRSLEYWTAIIHTTRNLRRLGLAQLANQLHHVLIGDQTREHSSVDVWSCAIPGLENRLFTGTVLLPQDFRQDHLLTFGGQLEQILADASLQGAWFDGIAVDVLRGLFEGKCGLRQRMRRSGPLGPEEVISLMEVSSFHILG